VMASMNVRNQLSSSVVDGGFHPTCDVLSSMPLSPRHGMAASSMTWYCHDTSKNGAGRE
jgi:hypothetical protein